MARSTPLLSTLVEEYGKTRLRQNKGDRTVRNEQVILRQMVRMIGDIQIGHLTHLHLWNYFYGDGGIMDEHLNGHGQVVPAVNEATHNLILQRVRGFFAFCVRMGYIKRNPVTKEEGFVPQKVTRKVRQQPSPDILLRMLDTTNDPCHRAFMATAMYTGLRQVDIVAMRVGDVDLASGRIWSTRIHKKKAERDVRISAGLEPELRRWLFVYREQIPDLSDDAYLFPKRIPAKFANDPVTGHVRCTAWAYLPDTHVISTHLIIQRALKAVGLPTTKEGTHTIRRAVARAVYEDKTARGVNDYNAMRDVMVMLDHESMATTERYLGETVERTRVDRYMADDFLGRMATGGADNVVPLRAAEGNSHS